MRAIEYPNRIADLVVIQYRGGSRIGFMVRPTTAGFFRLLIWPDGVADPDLVSEQLLEFPSGSSAPANCIIDLGEYRRRPFHRWTWALVRTTAFATALEDLARAVLGVDIVARERFDVPREAESSTTRFVAWSCHQPFEGEEGEKAVFQADALKILDWYAEHVSAFRPNLVWGQGDTAYSDGTGATDFSNQVYSKGNWYSQEGQAWLRQEYRSMYRHFWSIPPMRRVLARFPHLFIWDDHEIHDGWGSEGIDQQRGNQEMFRIAHEVADEYILGAGPRVRPASTEAHQAYVLGPMAAFIFDTRSSRNYEGRRDRLISQQQFEDFVAFLDAVAKRPALTDLITCTTVPMVGLWSWVTSAVSRVPDLLNTVISEIRDDVRDSWTSPGNIETLQAVLSAVRTFMHRRPDVRVTNISGDIHVANAFEIHLTGGQAPIYQVTTSAITNRQHSPGLVALATEIPEEHHVAGIGSVRRIWDTVTAPNVLLAEIGSGSARFDLKVWSPDSPGSADLELHF